MPPGKKYVDELIVLLTELKTQPAFVTARRIRASNVLYNYYSRTLSWSLYLDAVDLSEYRKLQYRLHAAVKATLLIPDRLDQVDRVNLHVLEELRLVGFELECSEPFENVWLDFNDQDESPALFQIVAK